MEARSDQNYLINFLPCIFTFLSFVFNSTVESINFMTCISNFLIRPINFMLHAFNYIACGINFVLDILYSYMAGCCPISDFIGSPLLNKSDIGQAADQTTVLLFLPRISILLTIRFNYFKNYIVHKEVSIHLHSFGVQLAGGSNSNRHFSLDAIYQKLYSLCCSGQS